MGCGGRGGQVDGVGLGQVEGGAGRWCGFGTGGRGGGQVDGVGLGQVEGGAGRWCGFGTGGRGGR